VLRSGEKGDIEPPCKGGDGNAAVMPGILAVIQDGPAVLAAKIDDWPTEKLGAIGMATAFDYAWQAIEESPPEDVD